MNFKEFFELSEAGKNPIKLNWSKTNEKWFTTFEISSILYTVQAKHFETCNNFKIWEFKFYKNDKETMITGDFKTHFKIVPTIINALDEFVKDIQPDILVFLASDNSQARKKLYKANSDYIASKYHYISINPRLNDNDILFGICKNEKMLDCLKEMIGI